MSGGDFWSEILRRVSSIDQYSYYQLLGVSHDAGPDAVREAFVARVSAYHPDRHAADIEAEPERGRALVSLQARLNEAYRVLSNPARRADYDRVIAAGELRLVGRTSTRPLATDPSTQPAKRYFDLGVECERSGDKQGATMHFGFALQLEPGSAAVQAALARLGIAPPAERAASVAATVPPASPSPDPPAPPPKPDPRQHERHPFSRPIQLRCRNWQQFVTLHTRDLSRGGLFVKTSSPLAIGTQVQLSLVLPDGVALELDAEVSHIVTAEHARPDAGAGMGLRFALDGDRREEIDELLGHAVAAIARDGARR